MHRLTDNGFAKLDRLGAARYGLVAALAMLLIGAVALMKERSGNRFHAGSEDIVIPTSLV